MSTTSVWVPIFAALAALFGGAFGVMLQGRYGVSGWRRQIRLQAYTRFVETTHDFDDYLGDALQAIDKPDFNDKWQKVRDACWQMGRAGSLTSIAGPLSADVAAQKVWTNARRIIKEGEDPEILSAAAKNLASYQGYVIWTRSGSEFVAIARAVLRTQGLLPWRSVRWLSYPPSSPSSPTGAESSPRKVSAEGD